MLFRPGMTRSGARQPGAVRSLNSHERQVFGPPTNGSSEPKAEFQPPRQAGRSSLNPLNLKSTKILCRGQQASVKA